MAKDLLVKILAMVVLAIVASVAVDAITCADGIKALLPCKDYLVGVGPPQPPPQCCISAHNLEKMANTTKARRTLCQCFKDAAKRYGVIPERAKKLPELCKIKLPIEISPDIDCSKIP